MFAVFSWLDCRCGAIISAWFYYSVAGTKSEVGAQTPTHSAADKMLSYPQNQSKNKIKKCKTYSKVRASF